MPAFGAAAGPAWKPDFVWPPPSDGPYTERDSPAARARMASAGSALCGPGRPRRRDELLFVKGLCVPPWCLGFAFSTWRGDPFSVRLLPLPLPHLQPVQTHCLPGVHSPFLILGCLVLGNELALSFCAPGRLGSGVISGGAGLRGLMRLFQIVSVTRERLL